MLVIHKKRSLMQYLCLVILWTICGLSNLQAQTVHLEPEKPRAFRFYGDLLYGYTLYFLHREIDGANPVQRHTGQDYGMRLRTQYSLPFYRRVYLGVNAGYRFRAVDMWVNKPLAQGLGGERILQYRTQHISTEVSLGYRHPLSSRWTWQTELGLGAEAIARVRNRSNKSFFGAGVSYYYPSDLFYFEQANHPEGGGRIYSPAQYSMSHRLNSVFFGTWSIGTGLEYRLPNQARLYLGLAYRQFTGTKLENYSIRQHALDYPAPAGLETVEYYYQGPLSTLFLHLGIGF